MEFNEVKITYRIVLEDLFTGERVTLCTFSTSSPYISPLFEDYKAETQTLTSDTYKSFRKCCSVINNEKVRLRLCVLMDSPFFARPINTVLSIYQYNSLSVKHDSLLDC